MTYELVLSYISLVSMIGLPIAFAVYMRKKRKTKFSVVNVLTGIVAGFLSKDVVLNLTGNLILNFIPAINDSDIAYSVFLTLLSNIILLVGLFIVKRYIFGDSMTYAQVIGVVLGYLIADVLNNYVLVGLSNLTFITQMSDGTLYENLLETLTADQALAVIEQYEALPSSYYLYPGIMAFVSLCTNYLLVILMAKPMNKAIVKGAALFAMAVFIYLIQSFTTPLMVDYANPLLVVFGGLLFMFAEMNAREMKVIDGQ